jgi:hypothetical protein
VVGGKEEPGDGVLDRWMHQPTWQSSICLLLQKNAVISHHNPRTVQDCCPSLNRNGRPPSLLKPSHNPISILVCSMKVVYLKPQGDPHADSGHFDRALQLYVSLALTIRNVFLIAALLQTAFC